MSKSFVFLRTPYNYDVNEASDASSLVCDDPSLAQQHARDECDINTIVRSEQLSFLLRCGSSDYEACS